MSKRILGFDLDPTIGRVGNSVWAHGPHVNDPEVGRSRSVTPTIVRIDVDDDHKVGGDMGTMAKKTYFADYPPFVFNVCFSVGDFSLIRRPGSYGDPHSHWFNVFIGYYQLDAPKATWTRPFGYEAAAPNAAVAFADILRVGESDWNFFSNYMYGVPADCIAPFTGIDFANTPCLNLGRQAVGGRFWDFVEIDNVEAVSAYESDAPGARKLTNNSILSPLWRRTFGLPCPRPDYPRSFISTRLRARIYLSFSEDAYYYHTAIFGATINKSFPAPLNERFLDLQLEACRLVISRHYPRLGFATA